MRLLERREGGRTREGRADSWWNSSVGGHADTVITFASCPWKRGVSTFCHLQRESEKIAGGTQQGQCLVVFIIVSFMRDYSCHSGWVIELILDLSRDGYCFTDA